MANYTQEQMKILINIIGAVETGGQIYGQQDYRDYTPAYANSSAENSCTIGAFQEFGELAKGLLTEIFKKYPNTFRKYDTAGIENDIKKTSWVGYSPDVGSSKAKAIQNIIGSPEGIKVQDSRIESQLKSHIEFAESCGVSDTDALFMCANFIHQGGQSACTRILKKTPKPYTLDNLYNASKSDTGNQVGAYRQRQQKVYGWLKEKISNTEGGGSMASAQDAIKAVIDVARNEIGYLEKASNSNLDSKTANAGQNNYTKYWRDLYPQYQAQPWCAIFVCWCFVQIFGKEVTEKLLKHYPYTYCPTLGSLFTNYANPQVGDIVIFWRNGEFAHTGLVTAVNGDYFETIEGNTSSGSTIVPNGGEVCAKSYYNSNLPGTKFCRVDWNYAAQCLGSYTPPKSDTSTNTSSPLNKTTKWVGIVTANSLNVRTYAGLEYDLCSFSPLKRNTEINICDSIDGWYYIEYKGKYGFVSGEYVEKKNDTTTTPPSSDNEIKQIVIVKANNVEFPQLISSRMPKGEAVGVLQTILKVPVTNSWNNETINAVRSFKRNVGLADNGNVGPDVWKQLMKHTCDLVENTK